MTDIDWQAVALAIRERRFDDIEPKVWNQVADKVETLSPKKRGRKGKTAQEQKKALWASLTKRCVSNTVTASDKIGEIDTRYRALRQEGVPAEKAKHQVASDMCRGVDSIKRVLTEINKYHKEAEKEMEAEMAAEWQRSEPYRD